MARKSRRTTTASYNPIEEASAIKLKAAAYCRLSRETEGSLQRDTIGNQTRLILDYIEENTELELYDTYEDDSVSGTSFMRPEFDRMLSDMRGGRIQAIVVKDLSRLGRDYIETGNLIENVFPLYGVRFISITDGFDSSKDKGGIMVSVTNLVNSMYAQDISRKINSAKAGMIEKGIPIGRIPYGYRMDRSDPVNPMMVIDEDAAKVVRRIFTDFISGKGTTAISRSLNDENVPSPLKYRYLKHPDKKAPKDYKWTANSVQQILYNETYTGKYSMAKTKFKMSMGKDRTYVPKEDWKTFENHHPAIISAEEFELMKAAKQEKGKRGKNPPNLLKGRIYCGCCGAHMGIPDSAAKTPKYLCRTNLYYGSGCEMGYVEKSIAYDAVFSVIKDAVRLFVDEGKVLAACSKHKSQNANKAHLRRELEAEVSNIREMENRKISLYEDFRKGLLEEDEYLQMNDNYTKSISQASEVAKQIQDRIADEEKKKAAIKDMAGKLEKFKGRRKLSKDMVEALVERVDVYSKDRITVTLSCDDAIRELFGGDGL